jgi:hypothetical protein
MIRIRKRHRDNRDEFHLNEWSGMIVRTMPFFYTRHAKEKQGIKDSIFS